MTSTLRRRLTHTTTALGIALTVLAPTAAASAAPATATRAAATKAASTTAAAPPIRPADDVYCRYFTTQDGYLLNWDYSLSDYLYYGTIVVHVRGTVDGSGYRGVRVENSGLGGWWRYGLRQIGSCWT
jgi:hypothetical protein